MDIDAFIKGIRAYPLILFYERCDEEDLNDEINLSTHFNKALIVFI